jgi:mannose-6-phosphate isomerase-like protein (cupin superfamily)
MPNYISDFFNWLRKLEGNKMLPKIVKSDELKEYLTPERCFIYENCGISTENLNVSIARARVEPGVSTKTHHLIGVQEIYLITQGQGKVNIESIDPANVKEGDTVIIPAGKKQRITNTGKTDLIFYCICTPAFTQDCYHDDEAEK